LQPVSVGMRGGATKREKGKKTLFIWQSSTEPHLHFHGFLQADPGVRRQSQKGEKKGRDIQSCDVVIAK